MRVIGIERDSTACNFYRVLMPLMKLREHKLADCMTIKESDLFFNLEEAWQRIMESDVIVFQRPATEHWIEFIKKARKAGKVVVADYDDNPFKTNPLSPSYRYFGTEEVAYKWADGTTDMIWSEDMTGSNGETDFFNIERNIRHRDLFKASFRKCDLVTCTTPILQKEFMTINKNTVVLPNLVDFSLYPKVECVKKNVRILWQGGSSHYEDLWMVSKAICDILKKYPNVTFVYFGDTRFFNLFKDAPRSQIEFHPWVQHIVYPYKLATLNCDIGLCPVTDNIFNHCKSSIKWMEYSVMKMATIASDIPPYNVDIRNGDTGLLVKDGEWFDAMERLINGKTEREAIALKAHMDVYQNHNADTKAYLWRDAYEKLLKTELVEV